MNKLQTPQHTTWCDPTQCIPSGARDNHWTHMRDYSIDGQGAIFNVSQVKGVGDLPEIEFLVTEIKPSLWPQIAALLFYAHYDAAGTLPTDVTFPKVAK